MSGHLEEIICPNCKKEQQAEVQHTHPFWTYIHNCECGYTIMESEWESSDKYKESIESACKELVAETERP